MQNEICSLNTGNLKHQVWPSYNFKLNDLVSKKSHSTSSSPTTCSISSSSSSPPTPLLSSAPGITLELDISPTPATRSEKMTNSGPREQAAVDDIDSNHQAYGNQKLASHILTPFDTNCSSAAEATTGKLNRAIECTNKNSHQIRTILNASDNYRFSALNASLSLIEDSENNPAVVAHVHSMPTMNPLNSENLLGADAKHSFDSSTSCGVSVGISGNPLTGHIGTSIAGISGGINSGISMATSHLHHPHVHHASVHQATIHSMTSPSFTIHSHLTVSTGQRRMSNTITSNAANRANRNQINKQFLCPMCNRFFTQKGNLKTHMMIHTGDKPYVCHVCGKSFTQKGNVDTHIKIHTGVKDYSCERCGKSFTQKGNLRTHIRSVHTKEKPYACSVCGKSFSQKGNMHTHVRTHNKDDRFPCSICGKTFSQKGNLKTHMQRHAGTLPKRYGPGGQRRQTTSRLLQVPGIGGDSAAAAAAAAAIAYAAGNLDRTHSNSHGQQSSQPNTQLNRNTSVSPEGGNNSRSPTLVHTSLNGSTTSQRNIPQSVHSNVQTQQATRNQHVHSPSIYPVTSESNFNHSSANTLSQLQTSQQNSFNPSAAAAAAAVILSSTSGFAKDHKANQLHFMSSLFH